MTDSEGEEEAGELIAAFLDEDESAPRERLLEFGGGADGGGAAPVTLRVRESSTTLGFGGTGGWIWNSSLFLARWLCRDRAARGSLCGRAVLELGCGATALPALMAARLGAQSVVATDICPDSLKAAQLNIDLNQLAGAPACVTVAALDVVSPSAESVAGLGQPADLLLFADLVYLPAVAAALPETLRRLLLRAPKPAEAVCWGCVAERTAVGGGAAARIFRQALDSEEALVYERSELPPEVLADPAYGDGECDGCRLYKVRLRSERVD